MKEKIKVQIIDVIGAVYVLRSVQVRSHTVPIRQSSGRKLATSTNLRVGAVE